MLASLHIKNVAIIDELEVEFGKGLNILTGETGAGKTIILEALGLLLGARASTDLIRSGEESASVTARFFLGSDQKALRSQLSDYGIESDDELIVHRLMSHTGKGKIMMNGVPATQQMVKNIAMHLVDVSSQHAHQLLLDAGQHVKMIDQYGKLETVHASYQEIFDRYRSIQSEVESLCTEEVTAQERYDFLKFQLEELASAQLKIGEEEELVSEQGRAKHSVQLGTKVREAYEGIAGDGDAALLLMGKAKRLIEQSGVFDPTLLPLLETLGRAEAELSDVARELEKYLEHIDVDPDRLEAVEERLHLIRSLKRKHGGTIESSLEKLETLTHDVDRVERFDEIREEKEKILETTKKELESVAKELSRERKKIGNQLAKDICQELADVGMDRATFTTKSASLPIESWHSQGSETIEFLFSPNPGEEAKPLADVASGGELSRILLAIKRVLADRVGLAGSYVFDEVDAGISGRIAEIVGKKLKEVAASRQVICITHLPQVAAQGDHHFRIAKSVSKGRTTTALTPLTDAERQEEVARMLAGVKVTSAAREHAGELLKRG